MADLIELDANFLVAAVDLGAVVSRQLESWLSAGATLQISSVAWSEYLCGPLDDADRDYARKIVAIAPFEAADAELASELFNQTGGRSRSHVDCRIPAHAIRREAQLATLNLEDFRRFDSLRLAREL